MHFGNDTTSRLEGNHALIKSDLFNARSDILIFIQRLHPFWQALQCQYFQSQARQRAAPSVRFRSAIFADLFRYIYPYALWRFNEQLTLTLDDLRAIRSGKATPPCKHILEKVWGIPCRHRICELLVNGELPHPALFDSHWLINRTAALPHRDPI